MQRICIYQNPNGEWIYQNLSKGHSGSYRSLKSLVNSVFRNYINYLKSRVDESYSQFKNNQIQGYVKNIIKLYGTCLIDFPGDLESGVIDESKNIKGTVTGFIFSLK